LRVGFHPKKLLACECSQIIYDTPIKTRKKNADHTYWGSLRRYRHPRNQWRASSQPSADACPGKVSVSFPSKCSAKHSVVRTALLAPEKRSAKIFAVFESFVHRIPSDRSLSKLQATAILPASLLKIGCLMLPMLLKVRIQVLAQ